MKSLATSGAKGRASYNDFHDTLRQRLRDAGYDATDERVAAGRRHLPPEENKLFAARESDVETREAALKNREDQVSRDREKLNTLKVTLTARSRAVKTHEERVDARETELAQQQTSLTQQQAALVQQQVALEHNRRLLWHSGRRHWNSSKPTRMSGWRVGSRERGMGTRLEPAIRPVARGPGSPAGGAR